MHEWVIGDLQGCYTSLQKLLAEVGFNRSVDRLIFVGDLVNRGPGSLACLRLVRELCEAGSAATVLGNHDIHLLAAAAGLRKLSPTDTLTDILEALDREELLGWLAQQPLLIERDLDRIVHAGLHPDWDLSAAQQCAAEVTSELSGPSQAAFLARAFGNTPACWSEATTDEGRQRFAINVFTRMRFVGCSDHALMLKAKGSAEQPPEGGTAWFMAPHQRAEADRVLFGHWSTLGTVRWPDSGVIGLDTGCVWNQRLTAFDRMHDELVSVPAAPGDGRSPF